MITELEVIFQGKPIAVETEEQENALIAYLQARRQLAANALALTMSVAKSRLPEQARDNSQSPRSNLEWLELAWDAMGHPAEGATGEQFHQVLCSHSYPNNAEHPVEAVKSAIRTSGKFVRIGVTENNAALWYKSDAPADTQTLRPRPPTVKANRQPLRGQNEPTVAEYAIMALTELGGKGTKEEISDKMISYGWKTKSDDPPGLASATMRKYDEFVSRDGYWMLRTSLEPDISNDIADNANQDVPVSEDMLDEHFPDPLSTEN